MRLWLGKTRLTSSIRTVAGVKGVAAVPQPFPPGIALNLRAGLNSAFDPKQETKRRTGKTHSSTDSSSFVRNRTDNHCLLSYCKSHAALFFQF